MMPNGPTRFGPMRDWKRPSSLRSASSTIGTIWRITAKITSALMIWISTDSIETGCMAAT